MHARDETAERRGQRAALRPLARPQGGGAFVVLESGNVVSVVGAVSVSLKRPSQGRHRGEGLQGRVGVAGVPHHYCWECRAFLTVAAVRGVGGPLHQLGA